MEQVDDLIVMSFLMVAAENDGSEDGDPVEDHVHSPSGALKRSVRRLDRRVS